MFCKSAVEPGKLAFLVIQFWHILQKIVFKRHQDKSCVCMGSLCDLKVDKPHHK